MQAAYTNLLVKREDSMLAGNLERRQIGEQFKLLDTASMPERPYNQLQRLGVMASGAGVGLVLGLLAVALLEYRDRSFRSEEEVVKSLSVPVLALIPVMSSNGERRAARMRSLARRCRRRGCSPGGDGGCSVLASRDRNGGRLMYTNFYGLSELPFELTANQEYLFLNASQREALSILQYGLSSAKSLTALIGEAGTGKTTLIQAALESDRCRDVRMRLPE